MKRLSVLVLALGCTRRPPPPPPPCQGSQCRAYPHIDLRFWRGAVPSRPTQGRRYSGALCVQVSFDCPERGRDPVWIEPEAPRCQTFIRNEGAEWFRVENGHLSIPWPSYCQGNRVEMYVSAQPNFAVCSAINNQLVVATRDQLTGDVAFDCR
ncbi:MAG: hypothetical protein JNK72_18355 [Myxococcales bacterium]|nr:hypothetical protein [Myxococcales bacterium]